MKLSEQQVQEAIANGASEAIQAANSEVSLIAKQINDGLSENKVKAVQYSIDLKVNIKVDVEPRQVICTGAYGAKTANLGKAGNKIVMEIEDPNQPKLDLELQGSDEPAEDPNEIGD